MKSFILLIFIIFLPILVQGQTPLTSFKNESVYINWQQQYPTINCQASFFTAITRTNTTNEYGENLYRIYFYSNSRYCNGSWAATYLNGINIIINGRLYNNEKYWVIFREIYTNPMFSFYASGNPHILITWNSISIN